MTIKLRLFASITLGVVVAAVAHAQAGSYAYATASVDITGVYSVSGGSANVFTQVRGGGYQFYGPYGYGNAGSYFITEFSSDGLSTSAYEIAFANPNGMVRGGTGGANGLYIDNDNKFAVNVDFTGVTNTLSYSHQSADGDVASTQCSATLYFTNFRSDYVLQGTNALAVTENRYNYTEISTYYGSYFYDHNYGAGSPYSLYASFDQTFYWQLTLAPYEAINLYENASINFSVTSLRSSSTVPGPAAVAPFAVGLLAALRR
jgi:hypothetical protein